MKVSLQTHGGLLPAAQQSAFAVDSATLSPQASAELSRLVAAVRDADAEHAEGPGRMRDAMSYTIEIDEGEGARMYRQSDLTMTAAFAHLLSWIERQRAGESR